MEGCVNNTEVNITNAAELRGKVAVFERGACFFTTKVLAANASGAIAVIIVNTPDSDMVRRN